MKRVGRLLSSARGAGASNPLSARTENTMPPRTPPHPPGARDGSRGAVADDPGSGRTRKVRGQKKEGRKRDRVNSQMECTLSFFYLVRAPCVDICQTRVVIAWSPPGRPGTESGLAKSG